MPATYPPTLTVEIAFATDPLAASPTWTDVSSYVRGLDTKRGRDHELGRVTAGTGTVVLDDADRRFDPLNTSGAYQPNVLPLKKVRVTLDDTVTQHRMFTGYVEKWPLIWDAPGYGNDREIPLIDGFEFLGISDLVTTRATLTTSLGVEHADLTFQSRGAGVGGNGISIEYHVLSDKATYAATAYLASEVEEQGAAETKRIAVVLGTTGAGGPIVSSARGVMAAIRANHACDDLVEVTIPTGSTGHGVVTIMGREYLAGGEYAEELSSVRVTNVLDDISWPAGATHRAIETGQSEVAEAGYLAADDQKALEHIQETADSEGGVFFMDGAGKATFHDRTYRWELAQLASVCTFGDGGGSEIPYETFGGDLSRDDIHNEALVEWAGATEPIEYEDAANQTTYGRRTVTKRTALTAYTDAESRAQYLVEAFKNPKLRVETITVTPLENSTAWAALLPLEIGDRVTIKRRPPEHPTGSAVVISQDCFVESIGLSLGSGPVSGAAFSIGLTPVPWASLWILADSTYGVLDSTTRIGY